MTRADIERRRRGDGTPEATPAAGERADGDRHFGVFVVALVVGIGGLADLATGVPLLALLFPLGVVVVALGVLKLWVAVGLARFRARALGVAVLLHGVSAMLGGLRVLFSFGTGGEPGAAAVRVVVDVAIVGYLLVAADRFE